jgi:chemotaxis protein MotB
MRVRVALAFAAALLASCGIPEDKYNAKAAEANRYLKQYQDESQKAADLEKKVRDLQGQLTASQQQLDQVLKDKAQLEQKSSEYEQLAGSLKGQIEAGQVELSELKGKMTVRLKDQILFSSGSTVINKAGKEALDKVAEAFKSLQGRNVVVAGYTDNVPTGPRSAFKSNWELSTARALAVVKYLQEQGVAPVQLGAAGFSEYRPVATNETPEGRSMNRRIEIALTAADYVPPQVGVPAQK